MAEFDLLAGVSRVVDLCAAPGSWSQVLSRVLVGGERFGRAAWEDGGARLRRRVLGVAGGGAEEAQREQDAEAGAGDEEEERRRRRRRPGVRIVAIDLQPIAPLAGITTLRADITHPATVPLLLSALERGGRDEDHDADDHDDHDDAADAGSSSPDSSRHRVDLVLSDGAPDVTGLHDLDTYVQSQLLLAALNLALCVLQPGGKFVAKIFRGRDVDVLYAQLRVFFDAVVVAKPRSSRASSVEAFVVCLGFRPPAGFRASLDEPLSVGPRLHCLAAERAMRLPVVAEAVMQDPRTGAWGRAGGEEAEATLDAYDEGLEGHDAAGPRDARPRWIAPFIACGDLSAFDSDASYQLPEDHVPLDPVQPPIAPPYRRAIEMRAAQSKAAK